MKKKFACVFVVSLILGNFSTLYGNEPTAKARKKLYEIVFLDKDTVKLTSHIHLIPPGSQLAHENVKFKDIGALPIKADLNKDAMASITFFEKKLKEEIGKNKSLEFNKALFNIYRDFMGNYTTDMIHMTYNVQKK